MSEENEKCEHIFETYRTESRAGQRDYRGHVYKDGEIVIVVEVYCKKCLLKKTL